jgi:SAM-dependent methyltransferase
MGFKVRGISDFSISLDRLDDSIYFPCVKPFWHPASTLLFIDPPMYASTVLLRMFLGKPGSSLEVIYAGDRMWPALAHGQRIQTTPLEVTTPPTGSVVVVEVNGVPDLLRIAGYDGEQLLLRADSDPAPALRVAPAALLAGVDLPVRPGAHRGAGRRRWMLDIHEAWTARPDDAVDPAKTVLDKYDLQAPYYAAVEGADVEERLLQRIRQRVPAGGRILVIGSGTGREALGLAEQGWQVSGVDFSKAMTEFARQAAKKRNLDVRFYQRDLLEHDEPDRSLSAVLFTYDVYSFLPDAAKRHRLLLSLARWLRPDGCVFLSARRPRAALYYRMMLALQWFRRGMKRGTWGASHTRWISPDGVLHRSFVQVHTERSIDDEARRAGFETSAWEGGHMVMKRL